MESFINAVPSVIWSGVLASFLTLTGVIYTVRTTSRTQKRQLEYEKEKYESERKLNLKKEVYLELASSISDVVGVIPNMANSNFKVEESNSKVKNFENQLAKAYVIAGEEAVCALSHFSENLGTTVLSLSIEKQVLTDLNDEIEIYKNTISEYEANRSRLLAILEQDIISKELDAPAYQYITNKIDQEEGAIQKFRTLKNEVENELLPLKVNFARECFSSHAFLMKLLPNLVSIIRKEFLDEESNAVVSNAILNNAEVMEKRITEVIDKAQRNVEQKTA